MALILLFCLVTTIALLPAILALVLGMWLNFTGTFLYVIVLLIGILISVVNFLTIVDWWYRHDNGW